MEKLSGILPSSPRVRSVDTEEAPPARPGAPSFGRKVGRNSINDRVTLSQKAKEMASQETMLGKNPKEVARSKMVDELNRKFFETRVKPVEKEIPQSEEMTEEIMAAPEEMEPVKEQVSSSYEQAKPQGPSRLSIEA